MLKQALQVERPLPAWLLVVGECLGAGHGIAHRGVRGRSAVDVIALALQDEENRRSFLLGEVVDRSAQLVPDTHGATVGHACATRMGEQRWLSADWLHTAHHNFGTKAAPLFPAPVRFNDFVNSVKESQKSSNEIRQNYREKR